APLTYHNPFLVPLPLWGRVQVGGRQNSWRKGSQLNSASRAPPVNTVEGKFTTSGVSSLQTGRKRIMAEPLRIMHYINAFFGGLGGEEEAHTPLRLQEGVVGPGRLLEQVLGTEGRVIATLVCGDGYFSDDEDEVAEQTRKYLLEYKPDVFLAGPAFRSGRYGLACGRLCLEAERLGIPAVTGMHVENPGSDLYRPQHLFIIATEPNAAGMRPALERMAALALKRGRGLPLGSAA